MKESSIVLCVLFVVRIIAVDIEFTEGLVSLPFSFSSGCMTQTEDGTIYNFGGLQAGNVAIDRILRYNVLYSRFEELNITTPTALYCYQSTVYSITTDLIYIFGAKQLDGSDNKQYIFNPATLTFEDSSSLSSSLLYTSLPCVSIIETSELKVIYIFGGIDVEQQTESAKLYIFNVTTGTFLNDIIDINDAPIGVFGSYCIAINNYLYVFGGTSTVNGPSSDILRYDINTNQWDTVSKLLDNSYGGKAMLYPLEEDVDNNDIVLIIGGHDTTDYIADIDIFHYKTNQIENSTLKLSDGNQGYIMSAYLDNKIVVFGGNIDDDTFSDKSSLSNEFDGSLDIIQGVTSFDTLAPVIPDITDFSNHPESEGVSQSNTKQSFFESTTGLLILVIIILSIICIVGICIYKFINKRQGRGYGVVSDDDDEQSHELVANQQHAVL